MGKRHRNKQSYSGLRIKLINDAQRFLTLTKDKIASIFGVSSLNRVQCDMRRIHGAAGGCYFAATANIRSSRWHYMASGGFISK
jgi:uncharacterized Fe-S radical SAM superfamily protein PflX